MTIRDLTLSDVHRDALDDAADVPFQMDEDAFRGFYDRTARALWGYLYRMTGSRSQADDLLQDAYYRLLRAETPFDSESHRRRYLFRIATNLVRDAARRARVRPVLVEGTDVDAAAPPASSSPDGRLALVQAMGRLAARERALLLLAYARGSSHEEIAAVVGVKTSSVKPLLFRARRRLARLLGREGGRP